MGEHRNNKPFSTFKFKIDGEVTLQKNFYKKDGKVFVNRGALALVEVKNCVFCLEYDRYLESIPLKAPGGELFYIRAHPSCAEQLKMGIPKFFNKKRKKWKHTPVRGKK